MLASMWRKGNPFALLVGMQTSAATVESCMEKTQKIKNRTAFWPSDPTSENIPEGTENADSKEHKHPYVHCSIIYNQMDAAQVSISRWVDKTTMVHLHHEILLGHKKEENVTLCNSMDGPGEHYAKWNKLVRGRQISHGFTYMLNLMNKWNQQAK